MLHIYILIFSFLFAFFDKVFAKILKNDDLTTTTKDTIILFSVKITICRHRVLLSVPTNLFGYPRNSLSSKKKSPLSNFVNHLCHSRSARAYSLTYLRLSAEAYYILKNEEELSAKTLFQAQSSTKMSENKKKC